MPVADLLDKLTTRHPEVEIWAAGGVVVRDGERGPEVLLVHRPDRDDWSLPKGKLDPGETLKQAALREVEEETGLRCRTTKRIGVVHYAHRGRPKAVVYWIMTVVDGSFAPNAEVDRVEWVRFGQAHRRLTYPHDAEFLDDCRDLDLAGG